LQVTTEAAYNPGKANGASVSAPGGTSSITANSITVNAVAAPGNGQTVEYGINTTNNAASASWHDSRTFTGLTAGTTYYIFARSKANDTHNAGTPSAGLQVATGAAPVAVTGVTLNKTTLSLAAGDHETLQETVAPANATNKAVTWSTSNASVTTVNNGTVTAVSVGTATITVTTVDGSKTASCTVTVTAAHVHAYVGWTVISVTYPAQSTGTCDCGETSTRDTQIGDTGPASGIIFYVSASGFTVTGAGSFSAHYLEAAPANQASSIKWSNTGVDVTGATGEAIGTGKANTAAIIAAHSGDTAANNAAKAAVAYTGGGKSDWFLPSKDEINAMYNAKSHLGISSGGFWSSSQDNELSAWAQAFQVNTQIPAPKNSADANVRAVRAF